MKQRYMVVNHHPPERCEPMEAAFVNPPAHLLGTDFHCPCPHGEHAFYMVLEGDSSAQVIADLPVELREGTRAYAIETFRFGS